MQRTTTHQATCSEHEHTRPSMGEMCNACRQLEEAAAALFARLQTARRRCVVVGEEVSFASLQREKAASEFPPVQRSRCQAQSRLQSTLEELSGVLLSNTQQEKDLRGLRRSLEKLRRQLGCIETQVEGCVQQTSLLKREEEALSLEQERLQTNIEEMKSEEGAFARQVADERQKRMELKAACRQRIKKVEYSRAELLDQLEKQAGETLELKETVRKQQESTNVALANLLRSEADANEAGNEASSALHAREQMHKEWGQVQKEHVQLKDALKELRRDLLIHAQQEMQAMSDWRFGYMKHLDEKLEAKRNLSKTLATEVEQGQCREPLTFQMIAPVTPVYV
ncbi:unnamed protein product [Durusdinium trenchii]|uniref:Myosin heavy chain n=2 Tax=Durusdinium trenchii TaxID=1381693 RepID=A0ABP0J6M8_9DINO